MLKFRYRRVAKDDAPARGASIADNNPDLRVRNLLDDPALRQAMTIDVEPELEPVPEPVLEPRCLVEQAA